MHHDARRANPNQSVLMSGESTSLPIVRMPNEWMSSDDAGKKAVTPCEST